MRDTQLVNGVIKYYIYDGEKPILEYKARRCSAWPERGRQGIDEVLMRTDYFLFLLRRSPGIIQQDHEGNVTHLTSVSGNILEKYRYDAYGAPTIYPPSPGATRSVSAYSNRFMFTGREYYQTCSVSTNTARRAYHPSLGRFMSEDPKLFDAGDYNLFRYCHNDPIDHTDPMGTVEREPWFTHLQQAIELGKEMSKQIAQLKVYVHAQEWHGGAIAIGSARFAMSQLSGALSNLTKAVASGRQFEVQLRNHTHTSSGAARLR